MQKYDQKGFFFCVFFFLFCLTYVEPKLQSNEHNQADANDLPCLIWIFEYISYLPCCITLIVFNYCLHWIPISLSLVGLPDCWASSNQKSPVWDLTNHFWHIQSVIAPSPYSAQIFVHTHVCFSCIFTFLEIIKHNMPWYFFSSSIFNIKIATQKFTNF